MQLVHKKKTDSDVRCTKFEHSILDHERWRILLSGMFHATYICGLTGFVVPRLKEEFSCIYRKFLLRQVRQNTFSRSVENNVKSKGGEGLCRTYSIAFLVSGCREPIGNPFLLIAAMFLASKITASASSRYSKAQCLNVLGSASTSEKYNFREIQFPCQTCLQRF